MERNQRNQSQPGVFEWGLLVNQMLQSFGGNTEFTVNRRTLEEDLAHYDRELGIEPTKYDAEALEEMDPSPNVRIFGTQTFRRLLGELKYRLTKELLAWPFITEDLVAQFRGAIHKPDNNLIDWKQVISKILYCLQEDVSFSMIEQTCNKLAIFFKEFAGAVFDVLAQKNPNVNRNMREKMVQNIADFFKKENASLLNMLNSEISSYFKTVVWVEANLPKETHKEGELTPARLHWLRLVTTKLLSNITQAITSNLNATFDTYYVTQLNKHLPAYYV